MRRTLIARPLKSTSGVAYAARRRRKVADVLQITPELGHGGFLQFRVNMMVLYCPVMNDADPEEPGGVFDRESMVGFRPASEACIVSSSQRCLNEILQAFVQIH